MSVRISSPSWGEVGGRGGKKRRLDGERRGEGERGRRTMEKGAPARRKNTMKSVWREKMMLSVRGATYIERSGTKKKNRRNEKRSARLSTRLFSPLPTSSTTRLTAQQNPVAPMIKLAPATVFTNKVKNIRRAKRAYQKERKSKKGRGGD